MIKIFNSLGKSVQEFIPMDKRHIKIYVCGPTVYDKIHIGNARPLVVFDVFVRLLKKSFEKVTYVRNITDVDDKINKKSIETGIPINELTKQTIKNFHSDCFYLKNIHPDFEPKATDHINEMIEMIKVLIKKNFAYEVSGNVMFRVNKFHDYGLLSNRTLDEMIAGARVDVADYKENSADFTLWKPSSIDLPGWESPWGRGRPGWHIECSAMSKKYLGDEFDIHGGGIDLVFPHHENEIAQSCCANETLKMARYWVHNGYVNIDEKKMSKSGNNFITISDLLQKFNGEALRFFLLQAHYRAPLNYKKAYLNDANSSLSRLYRAVDGLGVEGEPDEEILNSLKNDLNTPKAIARAHYLAESANKGSKEAGQLLKNSSKILGILENDSEKWFKEGANQFFSSTNDNDISPKDIEELIKNRLEAKKSKNYRLADQIRNNLFKKGIILEDHVDGTNWRRS